MNLDDVLKNIDPGKLSAALNQMESMLPPQQLRQIRQALADSGQGDLAQKLARLGPADLQRELRQNPALAKRLAQDPKLRQTLNQVLQNP